MKTVIPWFIVIFFAYVLQSSLFSAISYNDITVDLVMLSAVFISILEDKCAILYGFGAGLFQDLASGTFLGMNAFILMCTCIILSQLTHRFYKENIFLPLAASVFVTVVDYVLTTVMVFLLGYDMNIWLIINNMMAALIYNVVFAYPVYFTIVKINAKMQYLIKRYKQI